MFVNKYSADEKQKPLPPKPPAPPPKPVIIIPPGSTERKDVKK